MWPAGRSLRLPRPLYTPSDWVDAGRIRTSSGAAVPNNLGNDGSGSGSGPGRRGPEEEGTAAALDVFRVTFRIKDRPAGLAEIKKTASEVSDPSSPRYGQFLSKKQVDDLVDSKSTGAVQAWLENMYGLAGPWEVGPGVNVVTASNVTARDAERLCSCELHRYLAPWDKSTSRVDSWPSQGKASEPPKGLEKLVSSMRLQSRGAEDL